MTQKGAEERNGEAEKVPEISDWLDSEVLVLAMIVSRVLAGSLSGII